MADARMSAHLYVPLTLVFCVIASPVTGQATGDVLGLSSSLQRIGDQSDGRVTVPVQEPRSRWMEGALAGAALGGAAGWLLYEALAPDLCDPSDNAPGYTCEESGLTKGSSTLLGFGALIGGLIGTRFQAGFSGGPLGTAAGVIDFDSASRLRGRVSIPWK